MLINHRVLWKADIHLNEAIRVKIIHTLMMQASVSVSQTHDLKHHPLDTLNVKSKVVWWVIEAVHQWLRNATQQDLEWFLLLLQLLCSTVTLRAEVRCRHGAVCSPPLTCWELNWFIKVFVWNFPGSYCKCESIASTGMGGGAASTCICFAIPRFAVIVLTSSLIHYKHPNKASVTASLEKLWKKMIETSC